MLIFVSSNSSSSKSINKEKVLYFNSCFTGLNLLCVTRPLYIQEFINLKFF